MRRRIVIGVVIAFAVLMVCILLWNATFSFLTFGLSHDQEDLVELWEESRYEDVYSRASDALIKDPLDDDYLVLHGFAAFYSAVIQHDSGQSFSLLKEGIISLRRALLLAPASQAVEVEYVLGKAYYHMGSYYYDLAVRHLLAAYDDGNRSDDIFEYLGLAYRKIEQYAKAEEWFERGVERTSSPATEINLAEVLFLQEKYAQAMEHAREVISLSDDSLLQLQANILIGRIYLDTDRLGLAENHFTAMLDQHSAVADVRYWLGETYQGEDKPILARAEWREAVRIDPHHALAAQRLQN